MKTVYFLGAGASAGSEFRLPVMKGFFREEDFPEREGPYPHLREYMLKAFAGLRFEKINLEDAITHIELSIEGFGAKWEQIATTLIDTRHEIDRYLFSRLRFFTPKTKWPEIPICGIHKRIFEQLQENDSIISLNYDFVADASLAIIQPRGNQHIHHDTITGRSRDILRNLTWDLPSINPAHRGKGYFLKLHGSLNWLYCPNTACPNHFSFFENPIDLPQFHFSGIDPCKCGSGLVPVIIPPALGKSFEKFPKMGLIWNLAFRELKEARKWVLIGMSLPESDYYLRWLLRQAKMTMSNQPKVIVVNPCDRDAEKIWNLLGINDIEREHGRFPGLVEFADSLQG